MSSVLTAVRLSWLMLLLAGCGEPPASTTESSAKNATARLKLTQAVARNILFYHSFDNEATQPGWQDGYVYSISNGPSRGFKLYHGRAAMRTELNRMLDSLKATGPLLMSNAQEGTDTVLSRVSSRSYQAAVTDPTSVATSTSTSTSTTWVEGDSAATVRIQRLAADSIVTP